MTDFRSAVEARDVEAVDATLAEDVVFRSPVAFKAYHGKETVGGLLRAVIEVFEGFHYVSELVSADGREHALVFRAAVDGLDLTGCDFLTYDDEGLISEFMVMVRPLRAAQRLAELMTAKLSAAAG